jgi:hypothetical protein
MTGSNQITEIAEGNRRLCQPMETPKRVKVQAANGKPINACHPARARQLKRKQRVVQVCRQPYTIRLNPESSAEIQQPQFIQDNAP